MDCGLSPLGRLRNRRLAPTARRTNCRPCLGARLDLAVGPLACVVTFALAARAERRARPPLAVVIPTAPASSAPPIVPVSVSASPPDDEPACTLQALNVPVARRDCAIAGSLRWHTAPGP